MWTKYFLKEHSMCLGKASSYQHSIKLFRLLLEYKPKLQIGSVFVNWWFFLLIMAVQPIVECGMLSALSTLVNGRKGGAAGSFI